jgi:hypothetical protein
LIISPEVFRLKIYLDRRGKRWYILSKKLEKGFFKIELAWELRAKEARCFLITPIKQA